MFADVCSYMFLLRTCASSSEKRGHDFSPVKSTYNPVILKYTRRTQPPQRFIALAGERKGEREEERARARNEEL